MNDNDLYESERDAALEAKLRYTFKNPDLLRRASAHSTYVNEQKYDPLLSNERIEFLGDAVLELVVSSYLYETYGELAEGELTRLRAAVVCEASLAQTANDLDIHEHLLVGRGEGAVANTRRDSVLADFFEAIIGAIYLDGGVESARSFILLHLEPRIAYMRPRFLDMDAKSELQQQLQKNGTADIRYRVERETGPDHDKEFVSSVLFNGRIIGKGQGKNKKESEQAAAAAALKRINRH